MAHHVEELDALPVNMVGDSGTPNVFFVSADGHVMMITLDVVAAYRYWEALSIGNRRPTALEDRQTGVLASVDIDEEREPGRLYRYVSYDMFPASAKKALKKAGVF